MKLYLRPSSLLSLYELTCYYGFLLLFSTAALGAWLDFYFGKLCLVFELLYSYRLAGARKGVVSFTFTAIVDLLSPPTAPFSVASDS